MANISPENNLDSCGKKYNNCKKAVFQEAMQQRGASQAGSPPANPAA